MEKQESRIQILDRLSKKLGKKDGVTNWDEWVAYYDIEGVTTLVYQAMLEYVNQDKKSIGELRRELQTAINVKRQYMAKNYSEPEYMNINRGEIRECGCCEQRRETLLGLGDKTKTPSTYIEICTSCYGEIERYWEKLD